MPDLTRLRAHLTRQADACERLGSPMYAALTRRLEQHHDDPPVRRVLEPHADAPGPAATALRLLGSVHRLVLERRVGDLALSYPSVGGSFDVDTAWPRLVAVLDEHADEIAGTMLRPPQTNEVGRAAALTGTLLRLLRERPLPVRLHEIGASAGLNLRADRFRYLPASPAGLGWGPVDSPVVLVPAWLGAPTPAAALDVVERAGCDPDPVDPTSAEGRLLLTAYVWADQHARLERLRGALAVADRVPATVRRERAAEHVARLEVADSAWTVLWHSVMWQYLDAAERAAVQAEVARLGATADARAPFAHVSLEPRRRTPGAPHDFLVQVTSWCGSTADGEPVVLGTAPGHGVPVEWER